MYLIIDIGNTNHKAAVFSETGEIVSLLQQPTLRKNDYADIFAQFPIQSAIISSVGKIEPDLFDWIGRQVSTIPFSTDLKLPIDIKYATPSTLGTDRIANAVGAASLFPHQDVLSFQAGTCLVTDFINAQGEYLGGSIAPGMSMRFQSLHQNTANLPLISPNNIDFFIGDTTENSILSGVINGMSCEIDGFIQHYRKTYPTLQSVITGGDAGFLMDFIKNRIFAAPNLVMVGLYKILRFNVA